MAKEYEMYWKSYNKLGTKTFSYEKSYIILFSVEMIQSLVQSKGHKLFCFTVKQRYGRVPSALETYFAATIADNGRCSVLQRSTSILLQNAKISAEIEIFRIRFGLRVLCMYVCGCMISYTHREMCIEYGEF